jgi:hypothetical protein
MLFALGRVRYRYGLTGHHHALPVILIEDLLPITSRLVGFAVELVYSGAIP